jgi:hypothetical protein
MVASLVCVPPAPASAVLNASLSKASEYFLSVQELHPVELPAWLKQWSSSSLDFVSSYWNTLASSREQEFFGPHIAANLGAAAGDDADRVGFYYSAAETRPMPTGLEPISASVLEQKMEFQVVDSASDYVAIEVKDRRRRQEGGEWEPIKITHSNLAYIPNFKIRHTLSPVFSPGKIRRVLSLGKIGQTGQAKTDQFSVLLKSDKTDKFSSLVKSDW